MNPSSADVAIWFPQWVETLDRLRLPAFHRHQYRAALLGYLHYCKQTRQRATVASARQFVATTQFYTHVMQKPGLDVRSPLDG